MAEKVGIEINLINADEALNTLKRIEDGTRRLGAKRTMIRMESGELISVEERIKQIQDRLAALKAAKDLKVITPQQTAEMKRLNAELKVLQRGLKDGTANAKTFRQTFKSISSEIAHVGGSMQSLGNALTRLTNPFARLTTGLVMGAGYKALNLLTEGFGGAFERYDTMKNYEKSLKALGLEVDKTFVVGSGKAQTALENLNEAVLGLPTGLDEIVAAQKVYAGATGEMEKSTKTAIAANNAFLASGMGSREQRFFQKYMVALASGAELTTTQWQSMGRIAPLVMRSVAEELGYAGDDFKKFNEEVRNGTITGQEFLDAFIEVGTSGKVQQAANVMKTTWEGLSANIQNATRRMGEGLLKALDTAFESYNGRNLVQNLLGFDAQGNEVGGGIKHWLDGVSESLQNWVKAHPDEIIEFFDALKGVDWKSLARGFGEGMLALAKGIEAIAKFANGKDLSWVGHWMTGLNILGKVLSVSGGIFKGLRHPLALLITLGKLVGGKVGRGGGLFGKLASLFGKKKDITAAGETAKSIPTVADTFKSAFSALQGLITAAGAVTLVTGTGVIAFGGIKSMIKNLKEIIEIAKEIDWSVGGAALLDMAMGLGMAGVALNGIGKALGSQGLLTLGIGALATVFVAGTFDADMALIKDGFTRFKDTITTIKDVVAEVNSIGDIGDIGTLKTNATKINEALNALHDAFIGKNGSPMDRGQVTKGLPSFSRNEASSMTNLLSTLQSLNKIVGQLNSLSALTITGDPGKVMDDIKKALDHLQGMRAPKNIVKDSTAAVNALKQINKLANRINSLAGTEVNADGFGAFVAQVKSALEQLQSLSGVLELDIEVKLSPSFQSSVNTVVRTIKQAKERIKKTKSPVSFTIPVTVTFKVSSNFGSALATINAQKAKLSSGTGYNPNPSAGTYGPPSPYNATGGYIYRAKGGGIGFPGRPRGTDTVPAWLTPGEYVHNKRAVDTFGLDFMRKINNLDVKGAMSDLMHRAGGMANINRGTSITNNYNNNQKVVINNNGEAGTGYTFKRASRFVGAF